jgi:Fungal specific transcription factor domain
VVAQEHLSSGIFGMLFHLAAQCAKAIGLHQWEYSRGRFSDEETRERQNVCYCLYILDKAVCWTTGTFPSIPVSDVYINSASTSPDADAATFLIAKAKLAEIEETVYLEIYSNRSEAAKTEEQVRQIVSQISQTLQDWLADSGIDIEDVENGVITQSSASKIELSIAFFSMQLLLIWPFQEHPDAMFQRRIEVARRCMKLFLCLWRSTSELAGHCVSFPR